MRPDAQPRPSADNEEAEMQAMMRGRPLSGTQRPAADVNHQAGLDPPGARRQLADSPASRVLAIRRWQHEQVSEPNEDYSFDEQAAELIVRLSRLHSSLGRLAVPAGREAAALLGYGWWTRVVRSAEAMRLLHSHALSNEVSPAQAGAVRPVSGSPAGSPVAAS